MPKIQNKFKIFLLFLLLILSIPQNARAYLDPGTGSYFIQIIIGVFLGALFALKIYWIKIKTFFTNFFKGVKNVKRKK